MTETPETGTTDEGESAEDESDEQGGFARADGQQNGEVLEFGPSVEAQLNARIAELEKQANDYKDQWLRATA